MNLETLLAKHPNPQSALKTVEMLRNSGFKAGDIFLLNADDIPTSKESQATTARLRSRSPEKFIIRYAIAGSVSGALSGLLLMIYAPWLGHIVARHHWHAIILGSIIGASFFTIIGALIHTDEMGSDPRDLDISRLSGITYVCIQPDSVEELIKGKQLLANAGCLDIELTDMPLPAGRIKTHKIE